MPFAQIYILEGRTPEQKKAVIEKVTQALHEAIDAKKETIRVDLQNIPDGKYYAVLKGKKYSMVSRLSVVR